MSLLELAAIHFLSSAASAFDLCSLSPWSDSSTISKVRVAGFGAFLEVFLLAGLGESEDLSDLLSSLKERESLYLLSFYYGDFYEVYCWGAC